MLAMDTLKHKENVKVLSIFLTNIGIIILVGFLRFVETTLPIQLLFVGVAFIAVGNLLAFKTVEDKSLNIHFIFVLFLTTFVLSNLYDIRFNTMQGSDVLYEYRCARTTCEQGVWSLERAIWDNYFSAISVSLLPVIVSKISGVNLFLTFELAMRLVAAILPLTIFLTVKEIFEDAKLAALSSVIFSQLYFNFTLLPSVMRQYIAEISLVLTIFTLIKLHKKRSSNVWAWTILLMIFMFGVATYHYMVTYWAVPILFCIFLFNYFAPSIPKKILEATKSIRLTNERKVLPITYFLLFLTFAFSWITLANIGPFVTSLHDEIYLLTGGKPPVVQDSAGKYQVAWVTGSPAGPIVAAWILMEAALASLGFLYVIFKLPKQVKHIPWTIGAFVMFGAVALWISPSFTAGLIYLDRVYVLGSVFFTTFSASLLLWADKKIKFGILLFLSLNLPMNMLLPSHQRYVLYHKETEIAPSDALTQNIIREPSFALAKWLDTHVPIDTVIYADTPTGVRSLFYSHHNIIPSQFPPPLESSSLPEPQNGQLLFAFHYYNLNYELWQSGERSIVYFAIDNVLNQSTIIYNNGEASLVSFP